MQVNYELIGETVGKMLADSMALLRAEVAKVREDMAELIQLKHDHTAEDIHDLEGKMLALHGSIPTTDEALMQRVKGLEVVASELMTEVEKIQSQPVIVPENGRDGLDRPLLEPVDISEDKSYAKGTIGTYLGGLWIATKSAIANPGNDPFAWHCMIDAVAGITVLQGEGRSYTLQARMASGSQTQTSFEVPYPVHKGIWEPGSYQQGDMVTKGHSFWQAVEDTAGEPPGNGWRQILTAPKGKQGEPGKSITGPQGIPGRNVR